MTPEHLYFISCFTAFCGWLCLILAPEYTFTKRVVRTGRFSIAFAVIYVIVLAMGWSDFLRLGAYLSYEGLQQMFLTDLIFLAAWVHYLAFDLLVGCLEYEDALKHKIPKKILVPCMLLTFFFGPAGWLVYMILRNKRTGTIRGFLPCSS